MKNLKKLEINYNYSNFDRNKVNINEKYLKNITGKKSFSLFLNKISEKYDKNNFESKHIRKFIKKEIDKENEILQNNIEYKGKFFLMNNEKINENLKIIKRRRNIRN